MKLYIFEGIGTYGRIPFVAVRDKSEKAAAKQAIKKLGEKLDKIPLDYPKLIASITDKRQSAKWESSCWLDYTDEKR